jgi:alkylresorcinol/alkylpyrone synthase
VGAYLHGLSTALPPHVLPQDEVRRYAERMFGDSYPQFERLRGTFMTSGVETRHSVAPIEWFEQPKRWRERNAVYLRGATELFVDAAAGALRAAGWSGDEVDCVVTVSSTGIATPTLEALAFKRMGFRDDIIRVPVFGLGCAGGVSGLSMAECFAVARPGSKILLVVVETCTLSFRVDRLQKADVIATVLFGDGAGAVCLSSAPPKHARLVEFGSGRQKIWPDTLGIMGWDVDDIGFGVIFDRSIPAFVAGHFSEAIEAALAASGLTCSQVDRFVCHPGGAKVVDAIEGALHLPQGVLKAERETLRKAGNMSAPTVLFVLEDVLASEAFGQMMACALGPGFTASSIPFTVEKLAA